MKPKMSAYQEHFGEFSKNNNNPKADAFDQVAMLYFDKNFGSASKTDIDLLMFHIYMQNMPEDVTDYEISNELAITQQRVRNLRVKDRLKYGEKGEYKWQEKLAELVMTSGNYDEKEKRISLLVKDPNLFIEIENELEKENCFIDYQLNKKILQLRVAYYIQLIYIAACESEKKSIICALKERSKGESFDPKHLGSDLLRYGVDITTILVNINEILANNNPLLNALKFVMKFGQEAIS